MWAWDGEVRPRREGEVELARPWELEELWPRGDGVLCGRMEDTLVRNGEEGLGGGVGASFELDRGRRVEGDQAKRGDAGGVT